MNHSEPASEGPPGGAQGRRSGSQVVYAWLLVAAFSGFVLWLGTPNFSASRSYGWLFQILRFFDPEVGFDTVLRFHGLIRKGAHLAVYGVLALLAFRASWYSFGNLLTRVTMTAVLIALGVALIDEARQATFDTRTGSPYDVVIDSIGALCAAGIAALVVRRKLAAGKVGDEV